MKTYTLTVWPTIGRSVTVEVEANDAKHARRKVLARKAFKGALASDAEPKTDLVTVYVLVITYYGEDHEVVLVTRDAAEAQRKAKRIANDKDRGDGRDAHLTTWVV